MTHNETSGVAHFMAHDDAECLSMVRELLSFLPSNNLDEPPRRKLAAIQLIARMRRSTRSCRRNRISLMTSRR